jgi:hypothetical protein
MAFLTNDQTGRLAELIAANDLSRPVRGRYQRPLFRATALGDKYPTVDFIVDLLDRDDLSLGFFFVQVKGTRSAPSGARLSIEVPLDRFNRLVRIPAPTYLIGVDVFTETSYLQTAHRPRRAALSSITKAYPLRNEAVKIELYREVVAFWRANRSNLHNTRFHDA